MAADAKFAGCCLLIVSFGVAVFAGPARSEDEIYNWSDDISAAESSEHIARQCLDRAINYRQQYDCIGKPSEICRTQYDGGRDNQFDVNMCSSFSAQAWERIMAETYARLIMSGSAPKEIEKSQEMWTAWNALDCRTISDYAGTRSALDYSSCRARHAAQRMFELDQLIPH
jgi:uncharacterized protein YecT (DUF1311 family)